MTLQNPILAPIILISSRSNCGSRVLAGWGSSRRPPINESQTTGAAWIILALQGETGPDAPESRRAAMEKAIPWLDAARPSDLHRVSDLPPWLAINDGFGELAHGCSGVPFWEGRR